VGKLNAILSACLVDGYSPGTVSSITRSGSTATLTFSAAHGLVSFNNRLTISGCAETEYNGEFEVTVTSTVAVTYTVTGTPATPATGSPAATKAGSGWTKPYTGTNLAAFKQGSGSNGFYLYVNDTGTTDSRVIGYETMSSISDTSGNAFPTAAQLAGGGYIRKSSASSALARAWILIATEKAFYLWIDKAGNTATAHLHFFGDIITRKIGDAYHTLLAVANQGSDGAFGVPELETEIGITGAGQYMPRSYTQTGTSIAVGKSIDSAASNNATSIGAGGETYPSPVNGGLLMSPVYVHEINLRRGAMPGLMAPLHAKPLAHLDTFSGVGAYSSSKYLALYTYSSGESFVEISNTW
jgi:hypothetical protein